MLNIKKINISLIITTIFSILMVLFMDIILKSEFLYNLTNIKIDFAGLFNNFIFYLLTDLIGMKIIGYKVISFVKKVSLNENGINILKNKIYKLKKEMYVSLIIVLIIIFIIFFIKEISYINIIFIPLVIIITSSFMVFILLMDKYALK